MLFRSPKIEVGVVTYVTIIEVKNPDLKLKPGMTANVSIIVAHRDNALKIASAALRFRPTKSSERKKSDSPSALIEAKSSRKSDGAARKKENEKRKSERTVYVASAADPASAGQETTSALKPVQIKTGISDGRQTEVIEGLKEGDPVVVGVARDGGGQERTINPFVFGRRK